MGWGGKLRRSCCGGGGGIFWGGALLGCLATCLASEGGEGVSGHRQASSQCFPPTHPHRHTHTRDSVLRSWRESWTGWRRRAVLAADGTSRQRWIGRTPAVSRRVAHGQPAAASRVAARLSLPQLLQRTSFLSVAGADFVTLPLHDAPALGGAKAGERRQDCPAVLLKRPLSPPLSSNCVFLPSKTTDDISIRYPGPARVGRSILSPALLRRLLHIYRCCKKSLKRSISAGNNTHGGDVRVSSCAAKPRHRGARWAPTLRCGARRSLCSCSKCPSARHIGLPRCR